MSKQVALAARPRAGTGKSEARVLRRQGRVPAIAYGAELEPTPLSVDALELYHALHTDAGTNAILRLDVDGTDHLAIAREIQRHPVRRDVLHLDFVTVSRNVKVTVDVRVILTGEAPGVEEGGIADQQLHTASVEVLPLEVPDQIELDISGMQIGDVKRVQDLMIPSGATALDDPETPIVSILAPTVESVEDEAEEEESETAEGETADGEGDEGGEGEA